jgi:hypothetical protein
LDNYIWQQISELVEKFGAWGIDRILGMALQLTLCIRESWNPTSRKGGEKWGTRPVIAALERCSNQKQA